jgi:hypothetical protein
MSFRQNDIFLHRTEGWYGIVLKRRGEGSDELYTVLNLENKKVLRFQSMEPVSKTELPLKFQDLHVVAGHVEQAQLPVDALHDLVTEAVLLTDQLVPSDSRKKLADLLFQAREIISDLRQKAP